MSTVGRTGTWHSTWGTGCQKGNKEKAKKRAKKKKRGGGKAGGLYWYVRGSKGPGGYPARRTSQKDDPGSKNWHRLWERE